MVMMTAADRPLADPNLATLATISHRSDPDASARLATLRLYPEGLAFDPASGAFFNLSATALQVVEDLRRGLTPEQAAAGLSRRHAVAEAGAARDVELFLGQLAELGLWNSRMGGGQ